MATCISISVPGQYLIKLKYSFILESQTFCQALLCFHKKIRLKEIEIAVYNARRGIKRATVSIPPSWKLLYKGDDRVELAAPKARIDSEDFK